MPELIYPHEAEARLAFARAAVDHFAVNPSQHTFGATSSAGGEPQWLGLFACRWGVQPSKPNAVLVLKIEASWIYGEMSDDRARRLRAQEDSTP